MIGYMCKYAPLEVLEAMGADLVRISPQVNDFSRADALMHPNMCSFTKAVLEDPAVKEMDGIILTSCCDSVRRLYDVLVRMYPDKFIYMLDVPRKVNDFSSRLFRERIQEMAREYGEFSGTTFDEAKLKDLLARREEAARLKGAPRQEGALRVGLTGARCSKAILNLLEDHHVEILFDMSCTGLARRLPVDPDNLMSSYAWAILNQVPCMRMVNASGRDRYIDGFRDRLDGIICHTVKFCDMYSFEYAHLKEDAHLPVLQVETDMTAQSEGQIRTRVEAFLESLGEPKHKKKVIHRRGDKKMYVLGVDSGSTSTNAVILDEDRNIVAFDVVRTGAKSGVSAQKVLDDVLEKAHLKKEDLTAIVATGYGRVSIPYADENVTEISCHGKGAHFFNPDVRTILDIGGQDSKAIRLNEKGEVADFVMNDKCAAGTGRFLEMMARTLEIDVSELGPISEQWKEDIEITSMCTVFAESEVISLIAQNKEKADIAHGLHKAIANKACSLLKKVGTQDVLMMTGGVAKNEGVVRAVEEHTGKKLYICEEPEIVGAVGAAVYALEEL